MAEATLGLSRKKTYLELIRIIAILCVILNHVDITYFYYHETQNVVTFFVSYVLSILCGINVPLFFMISGALLGNRVETVWEVFHIRIRRIAMVLLLFSAFDYVLEMCRGNLNEASLLGFFRQLLAGTIEEPYWFMYAYMGLLVLLPFLQRLISTGIKGGGLTTKMFLYLLGLKLFSGVFLPVFQNATGLAVSSDLTATWTTIVSSAVFYFLCGSFLASDEAVKYLENRKIVVGMMALSFAALLIPTIKATIVFSATGAVVEESMSMGVPYLTLMVFALTRAGVMKCHLRERTEMVIQYVGDKVFGIYLTEVYARIILLPVYLYLTQVSVGLIAAPVYIILTFFLALVISVVLKKIPFLGTLL